jgi:hypothetical protein
MRHALKVAVELTCSCATRSFSAAARASFSAVSQRVRCDSSTCRIKPPFSPSSASIQPRPLFGEVGMQADPHAQGSIEAIPRLY